MSSEIDLFDLWKDIWTEHGLTVDGDGGVSGNGQMVTDFKSLVTEIFELSQLWCPVDTGALRASGKIVANSLGTYSIKYSTSYAVHVHEILENRHESPTRAKWLEDAAYSILNQYENNGQTFTFSMEYSEDSVVLHLNSLNSGDFDFNRNYMNYFSDNIFSDSEIEPMRQPTMGVSLFD